MAPTVETKIWLALRSRIEALNLASPLWPIWPIAWQGANFTPPSGKPWLAVGRSTGQPQRDRISRPIDARTGILTISAVMPIGQDPAVYEEIGGKIADQFRNCIVFGGLTLTLMGPSGQTVQVADGYRDGSTWRVPVNIPWRTWA